MPESKTGEIKIRKLKISQEIQKDKRILPVNILNEIQEAVYHDWYE